MTSAVDFKVVVPARYASTRLPAKPLLDLGGKPMVVRVAERGKLSGAGEVWVATDHPDVLAAAEQHGLSVLMTRSDHPTGTDRLAEVVERRGWDDDAIVVNVQGDEPLIDPELIDELAAVFDEDPQLQMATVKTPMSTQTEMQNPNNVKVVTDKKGYALYFSRSLLPYPRVPHGRPVYKHIGIYAYKREFLLRYAQMEPTPLEQTESLEQLRALENGYRIRVIETDRRFVGVDTPEDLAEVNGIFKKRVFSGLEAMRRKVAKK